MADPVRSEFGDFLRWRRERLSPKAAGLPTGRRRRTPGLRREGVAELAGIGVDWYVRLEQGRAVSPSAATIDALARALRLGKAEHSHLRALARSPDRRTFSRETVPEAVRRIVESLNQPAYVTGRRWERRRRRNLHRFRPCLAEEDRDILVYMLTDPGARRLFGTGWADEAKRMVAQFRATHDLWAGDPEFLELLDCLRQGAPSSRRGGKRTKSAAPLPARNGCTIPRRPAAFRIRDLSGQRRSRAEAGHLYASRGVAFGGQAVKRLTPGQPPTSDRSGEGFRTPASCAGGARHGEAGVRKPPKEETAFRKGRWRRSHDLWGFEDRRLSAPRS